jgi:hypothetical protein
MGDIQVSQIRGHEVAIDGSVARVACRDDAGKEFKMVIPTEAIDDLIKNLQMIYMSAKLTRETSRPVQVPHVQFMEQEPVFIVNAMGGVSRPDGQLDLRVGQVLGPVFQLSIPKEQSRVLYDLLRDVFATDDDKPN